MVGELILGVSVTALGAFAVSRGLRPRRLFAAVALAIAATGVLCGGNAEAALVPGVPGFYVQGSMSAGVGTSDVSAVLSPDGSTLYMADDSDRVNVMNASTGAIVATVPTGPDQPPNASALSPDGKTLYVGIWGADEIDVINTATEMVSGAFTTAGAGTDGLAVSPDGSVLYVGDAESDDVYALNAQTGAKLATISMGPLPSNGVFALAISPNGGTLYAQINNSSINVIDTATDTVTANIKQAGFYPIALAVSPDGKMLYAGGNGGLLIVNTGTDTVTGQAQTAYTLGFVAVSPDGATVYATAYQPSNALLAIDSFTGGLLVSPAVPTNAVGAILLGPSGGPIYVGTGGGGGAGVDVYRIGEVSVPTIGFPGNATAPAVRGTLTAQPGAWESYTPLTYQWYANRVPIQGATSSTFTPAYAQVGKGITVTVTGAPGSESSAIAEMPALVNPTISASVTSRSPRSATRWWRTPVAVTFKCITGSAPLAAPCPARLTLGRSGKNQSITRTIGALDGGIATITKTDINIDLTSRSVKIVGIMSGHMYPAVPRRIKCRAADKVSGIASCTLSHRTIRTASAETIVYRATAISRAGATSKTRVKITIARRA
jgi:YVTN family beta-propeller protein